MRFVTLGALVLATLAVAAGCSSSASSPSSANDDGSGGGEGSGGDAATSKGSGGGGTGSTEPGPGGDGFGAGGGGIAGSDGGAPLPPPGTLTSGAWDDNLNYDFFSGYVTQTTTHGLFGAPPFTQTERDAAHQLFAAATTSHPSLDLALVIDTTGSMGDEIKYLQSELDDIATSVAAKFPGVSQRWGLVVYRDEGQGDAYTTQTYDFSTDLTTYKANLNAQSADGGGDTPEAVDRGLDAASKLSWSSDSSARLMFWIADAPGHDAKAQQVHDAVMANKAKDVHMYPIAASGADRLLEYTMRSAAQLTGGRYMFLTDDSGIGGTHEIPEIPCFYVTKLNTAIVRMVSNELTGTYTEPAASEIIRVGGDVHDRACSLGDDAGTVQIF